MKDTPSLGQGVHGDNGNERLLHTLQKFRSGASPPHAVLYHTKDLQFFLEEFYFFAKDTVSVSWVPPIEQLILHGYFELVNV